VALGLKLKRRQRKHYLLQPCPALGSGGCSIYAQRPERCRLFSCQQLRRLAAGQITESEAQEKIETAQALAGEVIEWLTRCGRTDPGRPLTKRCEKIFAEPLPPGATGPAATARAGLERSLGALKALLNQDFRLTPTVDGKSETSPDSGLAAVPVESKSEREAEINPSSPASGSFHADS